MAEKLPHIPLYPGDWLRDGVSGLSLAAQGLWLRMMFVAHDSERYGYLEVNGSPMPPETIARRCGCARDEYEALLSELERTGVPSKTDAGTIYSRRMVRDAKLRAVRAKAGRKGGKQKRSKIEAKPKQIPDSDNDNDIDFEAFWESFPPGRKKSKARAREEFAKAVRRVPVGTILSAAVEYAASAEGRGDYVKMPATWLHQNCWEDDRAAWSRGNSARSDDPRGNLALRQRMLAQTKGSPDAQ